MRKTVKVIGMMLGAVLVIGCEDAAKSTTTDEPCETADDCRGTNPSCVDLGDEVLRCQSMCLADRDCGLGGACLFPGGETPGICFQTCDTNENCATGTWECSPLVAESEQGYCEIVVE
jgi:hypothetical protein